MKPIPALIESGIPRSRSATTPPVKASGTPLDANSASEADPRLRNSRRKISNSASGTTTISRCVGRNQTTANALFRMIDPIEDVLAPTVIERALSIFGSFKDRARVDVVQARKALTPHVFDLISSGQTDEKQLVISALIYLKSLEARVDEA